MGGPHAWRIREVHLGRSIGQDICDLLEAQTLFLSASSFPSNLVLLGAARSVYALLPCSHCPPGMTFFGFETEAFFAQLCETFGGAVVAYEPITEYYTQSDVDGFFGGVPTTLT